MINLKIYFLNAKIAFSFNPVIQVVIARTKIAIPKNRCNGISLARIEPDRPGNKNVIKAEPNCNRKNNQVVIPSQECSE